MKVSYGRFYSLLSLLARGSLFHLLLGPLLVTFFLEFIYFVGLLHELDEWCLNLLQ